MKKFICIIVSVIVVFTLSACTLGLTDPDESVSGSITDSTTDSVTDSAPDSQYEPDFYEVTIARNNGSENTLLSIIPGNSVPLQDTPVYGENIFLGWYVNGQEYDFGAPVLSNIVIEAKWKYVLTGKMSAVSGNMTATSTGYLSGDSSIMANTSERFERGTIEVDMTSTQPNDCGVVFCLDSNSQNSFWENGVSYYFFFISFDGKAYLGKVNAGKWTAESIVDVDGYEAGKTYKVKVVLDGTTVSCYVDGKLYIIFSEQVGFLQGRGYGIRAGKSGVTFDNFTISEECKY